MNRLFFPLLGLLLLIGLMGCQSGNPDAAPDDIAEQPISAQEPAEAEYTPPVMKQGKAVIIGDRVNVRAQATVQSGQLSQLFRGHQITVVSISPERLTVGGKPGTCDAYPWVQIDWGEGQLGWVYGKFVAWRVPFKGYSSTKDSTFRLYGRAYTLALFRNYQYGINDAYGLSGCEDYVTAAFVEVELGIIHFPVRGDNMGNEVNWQINNDDGVSEVILGIDQEGDYASVRMRADLQDGQRFYQVLLTENPEEGDYLVYEGERK